MNFRNFKTCLIIFAVIFHNFIEMKTKVEDNFNSIGLRYKSVKCQSDNTTIFVKYCYLKAISRKVVTFNIGIKFLVPYTQPFYAKGMVFYRYGTIFRQIIDLKTQEICSMLEGVDVNPLIKFLNDELMRKFPKLVHKCPYSGDVDLRNYTSDMEFVDRATMLLPQGTYRFDFSYFFNNSYTFNLTGVAEVKSPLKESFG